MISTTPYNFRHLITDYDVNSFFDVENFVCRFVEKTIVNAMRLISGMDDAPSKEERRNATITRSLSRFGIEWPTCGSITMHDALDSIENEMQAWNNSPELKDWMFSVEFMNLSAIDFTDLYSFEVIWSVPTPAYPEPQVTVSVFFTVAVDLNHPSHYPPDVTYFFESQQFVHRLNTIFQPKWLYDILDMKTMMFKSFTC
ncbi:hypothetical protein KPH14_007573 [Odynerus spinipes]|uniref:Uncharacterized protein n=1 Tax=Odynerus spinipes TaxID=1348599 RepID=A0AAD9RIJ8_9HYME|nr:hypothetical protein KPH14_007573 [Odynerus spinipes]